MMIMVMLLLPVSLYDSQNPLCVNFHGMGINKYKINKNNDNYSCRM